MSADHPPQGGLIHAVGFYSSDEEFVATFVPYCQEGLERGEPTVVRLCKSKAELLRSAVDQADGLIISPYAEQYPHAPGAMAGVLELFDRYRPAKDRRIRMLGELPTLKGLSRDAWIRYEAAVNRRFRRLPVHALCACDTTRLSGEVRAEVLRSHDVIATRGGGQVPNPGYEAPETALARRLETVRDPLEDSAPRVELTDPTPAAARHAVKGLAQEMELRPGAMDGLVLSVSEVLTNALLHGRRPALVRAWGRRGRVLVAVRDEGPGPSDPFVGLLPPESLEDEGGLGLWITHQLCPETALAVDEDGFTVRLAAGDPARPDH